jgi:hypothetical protein
MTGVTNLAVCHVGVSSTVPASYPASHCYHSLLLNNTSLNSTTKQVLLLLAILLFVLSTALQTHSQTHDALEPTGGYVKLPLRQEQTSWTLRKRQISVPVETSELGAVYFIDDA